MHGRVNPSLEQTSWVFPRPSFNGGFKGSGRTSHWTDLHQFRSSEDFIILDATGAARISLSSDVIEIDLQTRHFLISELSESQKKLLKETFPQMPPEALEPPKENWAGFSRDAFRVEERLLSLGCPVSVCGHFSRSDVQHPTPLPAELIEFVHAADQIVRDFRHKDQNYIWYQEEQFTETFTRLAQRSIHAGASKVSPSGELGVGSPDPLDVIRGHQDKALSDIDNKHFWYPIFGITLVAIAVLLVWVLSWE